jgi:heat shock protein HspQ
MSETRPVKTVSKARAKVRAKPSAKTDAKPDAKVSAAPRTKRRARMAKFGVGSIVRHKLYPFRGVVFDIDPVFDNTEEWWLSIPPELRPKKNQPYYHLLAENAETEYIAYVSEQNLLADKSGEPLRHPKLAELFVQSDDGSFRPIYFQAH